MQYERLTADQFRLAQSNTFEPGRYRGVIVEAETKMSKNGNPMIAILAEFQVGGAVRKVRDWVMLSGQMAWRFRELAAACGQLERYESGHLSDADISGSAIEADISIEEGEGDYPDRNRISTYHVGTPQAFTAKAHPQPTKPVDRDPNDIPEDDIPF